MVIHADKKPAGTHKGRFNAPQVIGHQTRPSTTVGRATIERVVLCIRRCYTHVEFKMRNGDGPAPFDFGDDGCASEWRKWLRGFDIYAKAMNIIKATEQLNWMLHYAGPKIQEVFSSLPEDEEEHKTQDNDSTQVSKGRVRDVVEVDTEQQIQNALPKRRSATVVVEGVTSLEDVFGRRKGT
ncbi:hypothetical protein ACLKA6_001581 [Drosophila palustris]